MIEIEDLWRLVNSETWMMTLRGRSEHAMSQLATRRTADVASASCSRLNAAKEIGSMCSENKYQYFEYRYGAFAALMIIIGEQSVRCKAIPFNLDTVVMKLESGPS